MTKESVLSPGLHALSSGPWILPLSQRSSQVITQVHIIAQQDTWQTVKVLKILAVVVWQSVTERAVAVDLSRAKTDSAQSGFVC